MKDSIYTIPISESFEGNYPCPFCDMEQKLEDKYTDYITGAAMMEPDIREITNKEGFCKTHFESILKVQKRLPVALMIESYLKLRFEDEGVLKKDLKNDSSCYICKRTEESLNINIRNFFSKYEKEEDLRNLYKNQKGICLKHGRILLSKSDKSLNRKYRADFKNVTMDLLKKSLEKNISEISKFTSSFNYTAKDKEKVNPTAIEDAIAFIAGK
jgi:hypothetical protein